MSGPYGPSAQLHFLAGVGGIAAPTAQVLGWLGSASS